MKNFIILCIALVVPLLLPAQNAKDELRQVIASHTGEKDYNYKVKYSFYGEGKSQPIESLTALSQKKGDISYFKLGPLEQVIGKDWLITVNSEENYIIADRPDRYKNYKMNMDFKEILADIEENGKEMISEKNADGTSTLRIFEKEDKSPSWILSYDPNSGVIKKIEVFFNKEETEALTGEEFNSSRLDISIDSMEAVMPDVQVENILVLSGKAVSLQSKYKKYKLHNLASVK